MLGKNVFIGLGLILVLLSGSIVHAEITAEPLKTATALRTNEHIKIDGNLSEKSWEKALPITGFRQIEPYEGEPITEKTVVKVLYDNEALYVGWWCYDSEPDKIIRQLTRRDRWTASDEVHVRIDSHHDHQTAYYFAVNAAGVIRDVLIYNNMWDDDSWDAVWEANTKTHEWGWSAEYKIPFSALRFTSTDEYTWGFDVSRRIARKEEYARWQFVPRSEATGVHRYGHLVNIKGIEPPAQVEILLDNDELNIDFRGIYTFKKNLTLQWYTQFYISAGDFDNYYTLENENEFTPVDTAVYTVDISSSRNDYNYKSLNLNLILRWEYRPGSVLYAVWTNSRNGRDPTGDFEFSISNSLAISKTF